MQEKTKNNKKGAPFLWVIVFSFVVSVACCWGYGNSYTIYVLSVLLVAAFAYISFASHISPSCSIPEFLIIILLVLTTVMSFAFGEFKSMVAVNISVVVPWAISYLHVDFKNMKKQVMIASIINLLFVILFSQDKSGWDSNSLAIIIFCGISIGFMWFVLGNKLRDKIISAMYLAISFSYLIATGCRNAGINILFCFALLLIPLSLMKKKAVFRTIYITVVLATIFAVPLMELIFGNDRLMVTMNEYTTSFSDKAWGMNTHLDILRFVSDKFSQMPLLAKLFGTGIKVYHAHNLFYQCLFAYGYIGTVMVYGLYIYIFEMGHRLFREHNNLLALSCCIVLIGHFLMQIGEVYMLGTETTLIIALLPAGIILQQNRIAKQQKNDSTNEKIDASASL